MRRIKASNLAIAELMRTAKGDPMDRIVHFEIGADDCPNRLSRVSFCRVFVRF